MGKKTKETDDKERQKDDALRKKRREEVATYLRNKVSTKNAVIKGEKVLYFPGSKAVDCLMESRWAKDPSSSEEYSPCIRSRKDAVLYCEFLLQDRYFIRAEKVDVKPKEEPVKEDTKKASKAKLKEEADKQDTKKASKVKQTEDSDNKSSSKGSKARTTDSPQTTKEKKKRKFRLKDHASQRFVDDIDDVYIWNHEPVGKSSYAIGLAVVIGAVAFSLRPLWPESSNVLMWYFTLILLALIIALVALYIVRYFLYGLVTIATGGLVELWIVPNLTNDKLGFFDSFKPLYSLKKKQKKKKKAKNESDLDNSDQEEQGDSQGQEEQGDNQGQEDQGDNQGQEEEQGDSQSQDGEEQESEDKKGSGSVVTVQQEQVTST